MLKSLSLCCLLIAAVVGVANKASFASGTHDASPHHELKAYGQPGDPKKVKRTVTVLGTEIAFDAREMTFKRGETVRFIFVNKGEQPHEFMIGDAETQEEHRKMMQEMAGTDVASMGHVDPNTVSAEPGEKKELVLTFTKPGKFEFACNYPGHAEVGMQGVIIVK